MTRKKTAPKTDKRIEALEGQLQQATENWKRALADYQNLEKRTINEKESHARFAAQQVVEKLIPVLDTLEIAATHVHDEGLNLALVQFHKVLEQVGVVRIETTNKQFDPYIMECVEMVAGKNDNTVCEEVRAGYTLNEKVIRPAQVKVMKK